MTAASEGRSDGLQAPSGWMSNRAQPSFAASGTSAAVPITVGAAPAQFNDKLLHMSICANLAYGSAALARAFGLSERWSLVVGAATAMGVGFLKELYDLNGGGTADWADIGADALGTAAGLSVQLISVRF